MSTFLTLSAFLTVSCDSNSKASNQVQVVVTTAMIADLVQSIGKEFVDVHTMMGPGVDPHMYRATEGDIRRLSRADMIFYNGHHLEAKLTDVTGSMSKKKSVYAVAEILNGAASD